MRVNSGMKLAAGKISRCCGLQVAGLALAMSLLGVRLAAGHGFADGSFEGRHTHSIGLTPDGKRLVAVDTAEGRLSVFNVSDTANPQPVLEMEIPVGIEPVALRARTNDEVWVVNEVSDSVSIVSLGRRTVVATLQVPDEPADLVFAQGKAFVSCARNGLLRVFDAASLQALATIPLQGNYPRALAVDAAGNKVFAAFLLSGNRTTVLRDAPLAPAPPLPTNPVLPNAPRTALIVPTNHERVNFTVLDRDVAEVDVATAAVTRYLSDAGTNLFDIAVHPVTGDTWVANSDSRNLTRFEPALRGHVADHRLTKIDAVSGLPSVFDLNPGIDYGVLPNTAAQATALAQPTALVFTADGTEALVAAFNSDRIARVTTATGAVAARIDLRGVGESSRKMRGPRALAFDEGRQRLYVLNKISNSVTVIGTGSGTVLAEVPVGSNRHESVDVREGRGFLFDARLSGNGTISCATCHLDADLDGLAWDLGDPGGEMVTVMGANLSAHDPTPRPRVMHPMKGPMTTQTLRAMIDGAPFHWRGDRATLQTFNPTLDKLMAGSQLAQGDIDSLSTYLRTLMPHPNPNRRIDDTLPVSLNGGNPVRGEMLFNSPGNHCIECHSDHVGGTNNIDLHTEVGSTQPVKNPPLRTVYQRNAFVPQAGATSLSGFGLLHDGTGFALPTVHPYSLDQLASTADFADLAAFILCFDTGITADTGVSRTFTLANLTDAAMLADVSMLEGLSTSGLSELVVSGRIGGRLRSFYHYPGSQKYGADESGQPLLTLSGLLSLLGPDDAVTFICMPYGSGYRLGVDRDYDGTINGDEPVPLLKLSPLAGEMRLEWPAAFSGWVLESTDGFLTGWQTVTGSRSTAGALLRVDDPMNSRPSQFYRLRRTW
ncbi:MAG: beta-propeller fold lactonase family protein [Verrucomicrobiota bacterium]